MKEEIHGRPCTLRDSVAALEGCMNGTSGVIDGRSKSMPMCMYARYFRYSVSTITTGDVFRRHIGLRGN